MALNARAQLANIPVVANETARMTQAFRSWPQSYWSRPAYCPGWTAAMQWRIWRLAAIFMLRRSPWGAAVSQTALGRQ